jgi:TolA-binding protein
VLSVLTVIVFRSQNPAERSVVKAPEKVPEKSEKPKETLPAPAPVQAEQKAVAETPKPTPAPSPAPEHKEVANNQLPPTPPPAPAPEHHAEEPRNVKPAPEVATINPPQPKDHANQVNQQLNQHVTQLRNRIKEQKLLDDVEQLTIAFSDSGDLEAKSITQDAELRLERILSLEKGEPDEARQTLTDSRSTAEHMHKIQDSVVEDAPAALKGALQRTIAALDDAASLAADGNPKAADAASVAMSQAESHYNHEEYAEALNGYKSFLEKFPNDHRAVHARYTMAFILQKKVGGGKNEEARTIYQSIADAHSHGLASHALYHIGESFEQSGEAAKALAVYKNVLKVPEGHARAVSVKAKVAFLEAQLNGTKLAEPGWANAMQKTHLTKPRTAKIKAGGK